MRTDLKKLEYEARNIVEAIAQFGVPRSPTLLQKLAEVEHPLNTVTDKIKSSDTHLAPGSSAAGKVSSSLLSDRKAAKEAVRKYIGILVLTPVTDSGSKYYKAEGTIRPFSGTDVVMQLVAPMDSLALKTKEINLAFYGTHICTLNR